MISRKLIENTTDVSNPSWTIRSIIFIAGWWKSSRMVIRTFLAIILMRVPRGSVDAENALMRGVSAARLTRAWGAVAAILMVCLLAGGSCEALSQAQHKKRKSGRPKPTPCRSGCVPDTAAVEVIAATADDEAAQRELSLLSRALRNAAPGSYERLSAF